MKRKTAKMQTRQLFRGVLIAALAIVITAGAPARATETTLIGQNNPAVDFPAVQTAVDNYDIVNLQGTFDFTGVPGSLMITRDVVLRGQDDDAGMAKIIANNGVEVAVRVYNPGGTVELDNLDIESALGRLIHVGWAIWWPSGDACKDLKVKNCRIVGASACIGTFGGIRGTVYLEGNYISGQWCAGDWGWWVGTVGNCAWEIRSNTLVATMLCLDPIASKGVRIENNQCEGPAILDCIATQGEIVVRNNTMIQSGHYLWDDAQTAFGVFLSHQDGFSGGEISGNTIVMNPSENDPEHPYSIVPAIGLTDAWASAGTHGVLVQDNTITGKADWGIMLDGGASDNVIKGNSLEDFTAVPFGQYGAAQILISGGGYDNLLMDNVIGPLGSGAGAGILCWVGYNNDFIKNDYTQSGIPGIKNGGAPCLYLNVASQENFVHESGGFPPGTGGAKNQVVNLSFDEDGNTTNTVIGHRADTQ